MSRFGVENNTTEFKVQPGSGVRRILSAYDSSIFQISEHFFEIRFPVNKEALDEAGEGAIGLREQAGDTRGRVEGSSKGSSKAVAGGHGGGKECC